MSGPDVTILMPFRDASDTLTEALASMENQTHRNFELLAIDDHSTDDSARCVGDRQDARFRVLRNPGRGLVAALNHGLERASTELVARMDADDIMHPERIARQFDFMRRHPGTDLLASRVRKFPEDRILNGYRAYMHWQNSCCSFADITRQIYIESPFAHPSVMFRRHTVRHLGGYRHGDFPEDYELWLRMFERGCRMEKLPDTLLDWRESPGRLSRTSPRYAREAFDALRATYLARDARLHQDRELAIWGAGRKTRRRVGHLLAHGFEPSAWIDIDPRKIGNRLKGVPVVAPGHLERAPRPFVLVYVANHGAREDIGAHLRSIGYREGDDYLAVG